MSAVNALGDESGLGPELLPPLPPPKDFAASFERTSTSSESLS